MSSKEKILVNIFERKNSIIEQIKQQTQSFEHYLASMCLLQGLQPPPWIFSSSDSTKFKKEEIISGLLLPRPQPPVFFSGSFSRYQEPTVTTDDGNNAGNMLSVIPQSADEAPGTSCVVEELDISVSRYSLVPTVTTDDGINAGNRLPVIPQSADEAPCTSCMAEELDASVSSPQECGGVGNNGQDHLQSLLRIQRSKSRQKALELRNSVKAVRNSSHNEDSLNGFCRRIEGSGVVSLRYDHAVEAELFEPVNSENETCTKEAAKAVEFGICGPQVGSLNEQGNVNDLSSIAKEDGLVAFSNKLAQLPNHFVELLQPINSSIYANANCAAEEIGPGDCRENKQHSYIYSSGIRKSETSNVPLGSAKEHCNVTKSCHSANQVRYKSIDGSIEQLSLFDGLLQSVKPSSAISGESSRAEEAKHGIKRSNEKDGNTYVGRITRSRSSSQKCILVSDCLNLVGSSRNVYKGVDDKTKQTTNTLSLSLFDINDESSNLKANAFGSESNKEEVCDGYSGRSRSCAKFIKCASERLNLDSFSGKSNRDSIGKLKQQSNTVDGTMTIIEDLDMADKSCGVDGRVLYYRNIEDGIDASSGGIKGSRSSRHQLVSVEQFPIEEDASNIAKPPCSDIPQPSCSGQEAADLQKALGRGQNIIPFTEYSNFANLQSHNVAVMETEIDCAQRVEAYSIVSGSTSVGANPGLECDVIVAETDIESAGRGDPCTLNSDSISDVASLGMENLDSRPSAECALLMKPKQLDFDDGRDCCLTETCDLGLESEQKITSSEMQSSILHDILNNITYVNHKEKPTSYAEMPLPKEQAMRDKVRDIPFEVHLENSAKLVHSRNLNSEPQNMNASHFENQIADSCLMGSWPCHKQIKKGGEFNKELSAAASAVIKPFQCNQIERDVVQLTVDEGKHRNAQLYITNQPGLLTPNLQAEKAQLCSEGRDRSASVPLLNEYLEAFSVSSPTELDADGVSHVFLTRTGEEANSISRALNASVLDIALDIAEENKAQLQLGDKFESGSMEPLIDCVRIDIEGSRDLSSISASSPYNESQVLICTDQNIPKLEGFVMESDDDQSCIVEKGMNFANIGYPRIGIERASLIEKLCKSAYLHTPLSHFSTTFDLHKKLSLYQSNPDGLLEGLKTRDTPTVNADIAMQFEACLNDENNCVFTASSSSDGLPSSSSQSSWDIKNPFVSPVGEFWSGITCKSGSSGKRLSSNPELPSIREENESMDEVAKTFQEETVLEEDGSVKREPLADITKSLNPLVPVCESEILEDRCSVASVNEKDNRRNLFSKLKENGSLSLSNVNRANGSLNSRVSKAKLSEKPSLRKENSIIQKKEPKRNNIVSNITSFIPLMQQKQADANITGKRDVKVKALEFAKDAKRLAEKKENERKMRKEAMKHERAQKEQENLKQMELEKEKKEEERKKKLADMAAKKRQREEEEKKEREQKRKCVEETRRQQLEHEEKKLRIEKENKELKSRVAGKKGIENKECRNKLQKHENMERAKEGDNLLKVPETKPTGASIIDNREVSNAVRSSEDLSDCGEKLEVVSHSFEAIQGNNLDLNEIEEKSYEISPYKDSDDEDDENDDDISNSKFIPSWASKNHVARIISSQQNMDPESIFPMDSFFNQAEVLLPRRLQQSVAPK